MQQKKIGFFAALHQSPPLNSRPPKIVGSQYELIIFVEYLENY